MNNEEYFPSVTVDADNPSGRKSTIESKMFTAKLLSPVHIGNGFNLIKGIDYVKTANHTFVLNMHKLMQLYGTEDAFTVAIQRGNLGAFLDQKGVDLHLVSIASLPGASNAREIADQLRDGFGYPMIPGSSIKGSLKTALYAKLLKDKNVTSTKIKADLRGARGRLIDSAITNDLFAPSAQGKRAKVPNFDIGRIVRVGDARFDKSSLSVISNAILSLDENSQGDLYPQWMELTGGRGGNNRHNTPFETISILGLSEGVNSARFSISFDKYIAGHTDLRMPKIPVEFKSFANMMNEHAATMIEAELDSLENDVGLNDSNVKAYFAHLEAIYETIPVRYEADDDSEIQWIQRIGWGSGWTYMTGGSLESNDAIDIDNSLRNPQGRGGFMKNQNPHLFPKTKKTVPIGAKGMTSMGWVLMKEIK